MIDPDKKKAVDDCVRELSAALSLLLQASRASTDAVLLMKISNEYSDINRYLNQALNAQMAADDETFASVTASLKGQAASLQMDAEDIEEIVADVAMAAKIAGYVTKAAAFLATL